MRFIIGLVAGALLHDVPISDTTLTWFILPAAVALILGVGGIWLARHTP